MEQRLYRFLESGMEIAFGDALLKLDGKVKKKFQEKDS